MLDLKIRDQEIQRLKEKNRKMSAKIDQISIAGQSLTKFIQPRLNPWADKALEDWQNALNSIFKD